MAYTVFPQANNDATQEPMFLGSGVNVSRFDKQKYEWIEKLKEKQISFFWRPEEVDLSKDRIDFASLSDHEKHIFISNLKYQTLLDSVQGRSPNVVLLPLVSIPELESWIETWSFYETIHAQSYTHIIRNVFNNPKILPKDDKDFEKIVDECKNQVYDLFWDAYEQEKAWIEYLFKDGSMIGLNQEILTQYLEFITSLRMQAIGLKPFFHVDNPIPWINNWLSSDAVQVAPQETEITSYVVGQIDSNIDDVDLTGFEI